MRLTRFCILLTLSCVLALSCAARTFSSFRVIRVLGEHSGYEEIITVTGKTDHLDEDFFLSYEKQLQSITDIQVVYTDSRGKVKKIRMDAIIHTMLHTSSFFSAYAAYKFTMPANASYQYTFKRKTAELVFLATLFDSEQIKSDTASVTFSIPKEMRLIHESFSDDSLQVVDSLQQEDYTHLVYAAKYPITHFSSLIRTIMVPSYQTNGWTFLNKWYVSKSTSFRELTPLLIAEADRLTKDIVNRDSIINILFNFVRTHIKYISVEDGLGAFIPRKPDSVFIKQEGDCKDMANLLCCMLRTKGIDAYLAISSTRSHYYNFDFPSIASGNHAICVVPKDTSWIFLDPTNPCVSTGMQPDYLEKRFVFLVGYEQVGKQLLVPATTEHQSNLVIGQQIRETESGYVGTIRLHCKGNPSEFFRCYQYYHSATDLQDWLESFFQNSMQVRQVNTIQYQFTETTFTLTADIEWSKEIIDSVGNTVVMDFTKLLPVFTTTAFIFDGNPFFSITVTAETEMNRANAVQLKTIQSYQKYAGYQSGFNMNTKGNTLRLSQQLIIQKDTINNQVTLRTIQQQTNKLIHDEFTKP